VKIERKRLFLMDIVNKRLYAQILSVMAFISSTHVPGTNPCADENIHSSSGCNISYFEDQSGIATAARKSS
jgi:hypothetical protein